MMTFEGSESRTSGIMAAAAAGGGIDDSSFVSVSEYSGDGSQNGHRNHCDDDYDNGSSCNDLLTTSGAGGSSVASSNKKGDVKTQQDIEVLAINKKTQKENIQVNIWRLLVTIILLGTAVAVTLTTYHFLATEEYSNFELAYEQFARTVGDAAVSQQLHLRNSISSFSNVIR